MNRKYPPAPIVGAGAVIIKEGKLLLVKRANEPGKGRWSVPGGIVDLGETLNDAVSREILEETGLVIRVGEPAGVFDYIEKDKKGVIKFHYIIIDYFADVISGEPKASSDVADVKWVNLGDLGKYALTSSTEKLVNKISVSGTKIN